MKETNHKKAVRIYNEANNIGALKSYHFITASAYYRAQSWGDRNIFDFIDEFKLAKEETRSIYNSLLNKQITTLENKISDINDHIVSLKDGNSDDTLTPKIKNVAINPKNPPPSHSVTISAEIKDKGIIESAFIAYGTTQDELSDTTEFAETETENEYAGVIAGFEAGTTVYFEIMATDGEEETTATGDYEVVEDEDEPNAITDQEELSVNVYPNPGNGNYSIELDGEMNESINVMVFNAVGKLVYQKKYKNPSSKETINITNQNDGIYFLKVTSNKTEKVIKLIKE
ncbi:MAG: T9SS type A sorting domain-containing protein [Bacteroidales bacterium]